MTDGDVTTSRSTASDRRGPARPGRRQRVRGRADRCRARGGVATGEVVFNTALSGYQEIITDPQLRRADHHVHLPPHRQLRRQRRRRRVARPRSAAGVIVRDLARRHSNHRAEGRPRRAAPAARHSRHRRHRHPPAHPHHPRHRRDARRVRRRAARPSCAQRPRPSPAPTASTSSPRSRRPSRTLVAARRGARPADRRLRLRHQDDDPAPPLRGSAGSRWCRRRRPPPTCWPADPTACSSRTAPATRPTCSTPPTRSRG